MSRKMSAADRRWREKYKREKAKEKARLLEEIKDFVKKNPLPKDIKIQDFIKKGDWSWRAEELEQYTPLGGIEFWFVQDWGWCIPTLTINSKVKAGSQRTYAVRLSNGSTVRIGHGPHVLAQYRLYFTKQNEKRVLKALLAIIQAGATNANQIRDRISTRRAMSAMRRYSF